MLVQERLRNHPQVNAICPSKTLQALRLITSPTLPGGRPVQGLGLPLLAEARALVERAAPHLLPARSYGWDVALTTRGPMLVEGNLGHGPWSGPGIPRGRRQDDRPGVSATRAPST